MNKYDVVQADTNSESQPPEQETGKDGLVRSRALHLLRFLCKIEPPKPYFLKTSGNISV